MKTLRLYVPAPGAPLSIRPESAIVGQPRGDGIHVHYQDNGADNIRTIEDRIHHAAGRMVAQYPTSSQAWFRPEQLVDVGEVRYDETLRHWVISDLENPEALQAWSPGEHRIGGSSELRRRMAGLRYHDLSSSERMRIDLGLQMGTATHEDVLATLARRG